MRTLIALVFAFIALSAAAHSQPSATVACSQLKGRYQCDQAAFVRALSTAKTVAVETQPFDRNGQRELAELVTHLGKTPAAADADLIFRLEKLDPEDGVYYGPNDRGLAALRVYSSGPQGTRGPLIWVETFVGQPDTPWPTVVYRIIQQLKSDAK